MTLVNSGLKGLTLTTLNSFFFKSWKPKIFPPLKASLMSYLAPSDSFEYPCYGSTDNINIFYSYSAGIDFSGQNLTSTDVRF